MSWYLIGAGIASIAVLIGIILISKKASKKHFQELVEQSKEYFPKIDDFFSDLTNLSSNYISKTNESVFSQKWSGLYEDVQQKRFPSKLPDYDKIAYFLKTYSNLHSEILNRNDVFLQKEIQENDSLLSNIDGKSLDEHTANQKSIVNLVKENPLLLQEEIAEKLGLARETVNRNMTKLQKMEVLKRIGADKNGHWEVLI